METRIHKSYVQREYEKTNVENKNTKPMSLIRIYHSNLQVKRFEKSSELEIEEQNVNMNSEQSEKENASECSGYSAYTTYYPIPMFGTRKVLVQRNFIWKLTISNARVSS